MAKKTAGKVPITGRAATQRINRALAADGQQLRARRSVLRLIREGEQPIDAPYFIVDLNRNVVVREHVRDLEELGRELGVIERWEVVEEEGAQ